MADTEALGSLIARSLKPGDVVLLEGEVGSGKTTLVRGAARALGWGGPVTSPTYALANRYETPGGPAIAHLDVHRLGALAGEDEGLLDDSLTPDAIAFVEWPEIARAALPRGPRFVVRLAHDGDGRRAMIEEPGR